MKPTKEVHFSIAEKEWIDILQEMGASYLQATEYVITYKREQAFMYKQQGNEQLFCQLMDELGELTEEMKQAAAPATEHNYKQIIVPENNND